MQNLFAFIYRYRAFLIFIFLETVSIYLLILNNSYHNASFYNSSNYYVGKVLEFQSEVTEYFRLVQVNATLVQENAELREKLYQQQNMPVPDSVRQQTDSVRAGFDSTLTLPYILRPAKVINNSVRRLNNYLTINIGKKDGVRQGMGVISPVGIVGRVKVVSDNYSTVTSVLHTQMLVSAKIKRENSFGSVKWDGEDPSIVMLHYIPLHVKPQVGDSVVTSGFNTVFPEGILIGRISSFEKEPDKSFYTIRVKLSVDYSKVAFVYVVENLRQAEIDSLNAKTGIREDHE